MGPHMKALSPISDFSPFLAHSATHSYLLYNYQVPFWGLSDLTFQWQDWQKCMIPLLKAGFMELLIGYFLAHSATLSYLYNNYQVLFWGFGRFSPTAFSRLWQMGPHMKALSPRSDFSPFWAHSATLSYLRLNKNERAKCECCQCLSKWEVQTWYLAPCQNRWDFGLLLKLVSPRFMDSTLSYGPKRKGPPSIAKDWRLAALLLHCVLFPIIINWF